MARATTRRKLGCCGCSALPPGQLGYRRTLGDFVDFVPAINSAIQGGVALAAAAINRPQQPRIVYQAPAPVPAPQPSVNRYTAAPPSSSEVFAGLSTKDMVIGGVAVAALLVAATAGRR